MTESSIRPRPSSSTVRPCPWQSATDAWRSSGLAADRISMPFCPAPRTSTRSKVPAAASVTTSAAVAVPRTRHLENIGSLASPTTTPAAPVSATMQSLNEPRDRPASEIPSPPVRVTEHRRTTGSASPASTMPCDPVSRISQSSSTGRASDSMSTPTPPISWIHAEVIRVELRSRNATAVPVIRVISQPCRSPRAPAAVASPMPSTSLIRQSLKAGSAPDEMVTPSWLTCSITVRSNVPLAPSATTTPSPAELRTRPSCISTAASAPRTSMAALAQAMTSHSARVSEPPVTAVTAAARSWPDKLIPRSVADPLDSVTAGPAAGATITLPAAWAAVMVTGRVSIRLSAYWPGSTLMVAPAGATIRAAAIDRYPPWPSGDTVIVAGSAAMPPVTRFTGTHLES